MNRISVTVHYLLVVACLLATSLLLSIPSPSRAADFDDALKRMDAIIAEMQILRNEFQQLAVNVNAVAGTPSVLGAATSADSPVPVFTQSLQFGDTNDDIARIQKLLATDSEIYGHGVVSGFYGPKTQEAVRNLQSRYGLESVGVIGPATKALLELIFRAYPDDEYPSDVLERKASTLGAGTSESSGSAPTPVSTPSTPADSSELISIEVEFDNDEAVVRIDYKTKRDKAIVVDSEDEDDVIDAILEKTDLNESVVRNIIEFDTNTSSSKSSGDEDDADDAIDDADDALDAARDKIEEADDDGEEVDYAEETLDEGRDKLDDAEDAFDDEDYDEAEELAKEAEELAEKAEDRIGKNEGEDKGDADEITKIEAEVDEDEAEITVSYEDDDDFVFTVEEDDEDDIITEVADELDIDEDDVEDFIEFDFGDLEQVIVEVEDGEARVVAEYESGVKRKIVIDEDSEEDMIEEIADELDERESDIERVIDFDFND